MELRIEETAEPRTFRVVGEVDLSNAEQLRSSLEPVAEAGGDLVLDLSELSFIDSSGVRALLRLYEALGGGRLVLRTPSPGVRQVLSIMGLDDQDRILVEDSGPGKPGPG